MLTHLIGHPVTVKTPEYQFNCVLIDPTPFDPAEISSVEDDVITIAPYTGISSVPAKQAPDVSLEIFHAAVDLKATHLSTDGQRAYTNRYDLRVHFWDGLAFGSGFPCEKLPGDAVEI